MQITRVTGPNCEVEINECASFPCRNGGDCIDLIGSYLCNCPDDFGGFDCEVLVNHCGSSPCLNGKNANT